MPPRSRAGPRLCTAGSGFWGLHVDFNSRPLCPEVTQGNHVKGLCIKRLKTTYVNSGLQPKLPSCLAETGSWQTKKRAHTIEMSLSGERKKGITINETKVRQAWLQEMVREECEHCGYVLSLPQVPWEMRQTFLWCTGGVGMLVLAKDTLSFSCWDCVAAVSLIELYIGD